MKTIVMILALVFFTSHSGAQEGEHQKTQSLTQWREQQLIDAQNRVVRLSNRITLLRNQNAEPNEITRLEIEKKVAAHSVELVSEFSLEDYFNMYLSQFAEKDAVLAEVARTMTKQEVAQLLKLFLQSRTTAPGTETASPVISGMNISTSDQQNL